MGHADEVQLDGAGRALISPELRRYAKLDKQVWLVGQGNGLELWSDADWQRECEAASALSEQGPPPGLETLVL
jgi:MraZ protein